MTESNRTARVRLVGLAKSNEAYELRDFLQRSVVALTGWNCKTMRIANESLAFHSSRMPGFRW
jgi:hypothetical protein